MRSFSNTLIYPFWPTNFIEGLGVSGREEGEVIMAGTSAPEEISAEIDSDFSISPWRYAVDPAEHNKGGFDLWIEVDVLSQHFVVGNWDGAR